MPTVYVSYSVMGIVDLWLNSCLPDSSTNFCIHAEVLANSIYFLIPAVCTVLYSLHNIFIPNVSFYLHNDEQTDS